MFKISIYTMNSNLGDKCFRIITEFMYRLTTSVILAANYFTSFHSHFTAVRIARSFTKMFSMSRSMTSKKKVMFLSPSMTSLIHPMEEG